MRRLSCRAGQPELRKGVSVGPARARSLNRACRRLGGAHSDGVKIGGQEIRGLGRPECALNGRAVRCHGRNSCRNWGSGVW